jgi:hypothetical protein
VTKNIFATAQFMRRFGRGRKRTLWIKWACFELAEHFSAAVCVGGGNAAKTRSESGAPRLA